MQATPKKALVLGATGMVGEPLTRALVDDGWAVAGAARYSRPEKKEVLEALGVETVVFDALQDDPAALPEVDVVFLEIWDPKTFSSSDREFVWGYNFHAVGRVVQRYAGVADIVNGCTVNVYGESREPPSEETPCRPTSEYGRSRFAQERLIDFFCQEGGARGIHVRYQHSNLARVGLVHNLARSILKEKSLGPNPDSRLQVIAVEDFVNVTKRAVERLASPPALVNCCHPRVWTRRELAEAIHARLGRGKVVFDREHGGDELSIHADVARMVEWFGEPRITPQELIERTVRAVLE